MNIEEVKKNFPENWNKWENAIGYCYLTYCHNTGEFYVGKKQNAQFIDTYYGSGTAVKNWKRMKYHLEHWPISWTTTTQELLNHECEWVTKAQTFMDCVNLKPGGASAMSGRKHSPETIQKMRESAKKIKHTPMSQETKNKISKANKGKHNKTEEQRKAVGDFHRGRKRSEETCKKIGDSKRGKNNPNFGKPRDEETKAKIATSNIGKHNK